MLGVVPTFMAPSRRGVKPVGNVTIDWSHPLTRKLVGAYYTTSHGCIDLFDGTQGTKGGTPSQDQNSQEFTSSSDNYSFTNRTVSNLGETLGIAFGYKGSSTNSYRRIFDSVGSQYIASLNTTDQFILRQDSGDIIITPTNYLFEDDIMHHHAAGGTIPSSAAADVEYYTDGVLNGTYTSTLFNTGEPTTGTIYIGNDAVGQPCLGVVAYVYLFSHLDHPEAQAISENPYQILKPVNNFSYLTGLSAGSNWEIPVPPGGTPY